MKNTQKHAFTLIEVVIVLVLVVSLYLISVILINPTSIFKASQNTQREVDIKNIKTAFDKYFSEDSTDGSVRNIYNFDGFLALKSTAINNGWGSCPNAISNGLKETVPGAYDLNTTGDGNFIDISLLIKEKYLAKVLKDPVDGSTYKACIDSASSNQLVIFAPNTEGETKFSISLNPGVEGVSENLVKNPSFEININNYTVDNGKLEKVSSGATVLFPKIGNFYADFTVKDSGYSVVSTTIADWKPGSTFTGSVSVDKKKYTGTVKFELQDFDGSNWSNSEILIDKPGRYAVTRTISKNAKDFRILVSAVGGTGNIYVDGFQIEKRTVVTSYIDGSRGKNYVWNGEANNSTSKRLN